MALNTDILLIELQSVVLDRLLVIFVALWVIPNLHLKFGTLENQRLEPKNHPIEKENHPNLQFWVTAVKNETPSMPTRTVVLGNACAAKVRRHFMGTQIGQDSAQDEP